MAERRGTTRQQTTRYQTYGNVAYQPVPERRAANEPLHRPARPDPRPAPRPKVQPRERTVVRPSVEVRPQEAVSPFAIAGFAAVALCAVLLLMTYVRLAVVNAETVALRSELTALETEEKRLLTEYELSYDLTAIEQELISSGKMVRADPKQIIYLDLSEGDNVTYYDETTGWFSGWVDRIERLIDSLME